jgi:hypothetical protein
MLRQCRLIFIITEKGILMGNIRLETVEITVANGPLVIVGVMNNSSRQNFPNPQLGQTEDCLEILGE